MDERLVTGSVEYRAGETPDSPGHLRIEALRVNTRARDRAEAFDALPEVPAEGVLLGRLHPAARAPIMMAPVEVRDGVMVVDVQLPNTEAGKQAAVEVRNGTLREASIEFRATVARMVGGVRRIASSGLQAIALVPRGSYQSQAEVRTRRRRRAWR